MRIAKITIKGFRSFNSDGVVINLQKKLNVLIGLNSSGKTAALEALNKVFGIMKSERDIQFKDFHIGYDEDPTLIEEKLLSIEVKMMFDDSDEEPIPHFFSHMLIDNEGSEPYIRLRLEGKWQKSPYSIEGDIETSLYFISVPESEPESEDSKRIYPKHLKGLIQVLYIPAIRKPSDQIRFVSGSALHRVLRLMKFDDEFRKKFNESVEGINSLFEGHKEFSEIQKTLSSFWEKFHKDERYKQSKLGFGSSDVDSILKKIEVSFNPTETSRAFEINDLGEGYRSLFYLTIICAILEVESKMNQDEQDEIKPILTILAVEEPENHIAPQLLGRVVSILKNISNQINTQVFLSSHTPAIIKRIEPESIFHFRIDSEYKSDVNSILLPDKDEEAYKYVKEAVKNYPELYFARLAVIGEGESEEIVFNRLMEIKETDFDDHIITFIPLGHRFVNHIWKLLKALHIPYITLLDLDVERFGGGWGRIKYIIQQLMEIGIKKKDLLTLKGGSIMSDKRFSDMHNWEYKENKLDSVLTWVKFLKKYNVYYSQPLDLDFLLLEHYTENYKRIIPKGGGPRIPDKETKEEDYNAKLSTAIKSTLKSDEATASTYEEKQKELMIWYNYLFLGRGKPTTHISALSFMTNEEIADRLPQVFEDIFQRIKELLDE